MKPLNFENKNFSPTDSGLSKRSGFTLIETLVSITIFLLVSTAAMSALHASQRTRNISQDSVTATYLAAEGIELIRAKRDANRIQIAKGLRSDETVFDGIANGGCVEDVECSIFDNSNPNLPVLDECDGDTNCSLKYSSTNGFVASRPSNASLLQSKFTRYAIYKQSSSSPDRLEINSFVEWQDVSGRNNQIKVTEVLFNW